MWSYVAEVTSFPHYATDVSDRELSADSHGRQHCVRTVTQAQGNFGVLIYFFTPISFLLNAVCSVLTQNQVVSCLAKMLDFFAIFSKGGIVLWCFQGAGVSESFTGPVNALIRSVILQVKSLLGLLWIIVEFTNVIQAGEISPAQPS